MRPDACEGKNPAVNERGSDHHPIRQMVAARDVWIVQNEQITRLDPGPEVAQHGANGEAPPASMNRDAVRLRDHFAGRVRKKAGEIVRLVEDRTVGRANHHPAHLMRNVIQPLLRQGEDNRIKHGRHPGIAR